MFRETNSTSGLSQQRLTNTMGPIKPGYKGDPSRKAEFPDINPNKLERMSKPPIDDGLRRTLPIDALHTGAHFQPTTILQGEPIHTGNETDFMILQRPEVEGAVLFTVQTKDGGIGYTRDGSFVLDDDKQLTTKSGQLLVDDDHQPIQLPTDQFQLLPNGAIQAEEKQVATIGLSYANNVAQLIEQNSVLRHFQHKMLPKANPQQFEMFQGYLEKR